MRTPYPSALSVRVLLLLASLAAAGAVAACVAANPPTDTGNPVAPDSTGAPSSPTPGSIQPLAYEQDLKPIFASDCVVCHSGSRPSGNYSMSTYAQVMRDVTPGSVRSPLVTTTQANGSMYRYWTGDRAAKADIVRRWVVNNNAAQSR